MFEDTITSSSLSTTISNKDSPLRKIIFIKQCCLFASKTPSHALNFTRAINNEFSEAMIEYRGFQTSLLNILSTDSSSSSNDHALTIQEFHELEYYERRAFSVSRFIYHLCHYCPNNAGRWIFIELIESNLMHPQRAIEYILEGEDEDEVAECLRVLFQRAKQRDAEERLHQIEQLVSQNSMNGLTWTEEELEEACSKIIIPSTAKALADTPVGLYQKIVDERREAKQQKKHDKKAAFYAEAPKIAHARTFFSSSSSGTTSSDDHAFGKNNNNNNSNRKKTKCQTEGELIDSFILNISRPIMLAVKKDFAKVVKVLLEEGEAEWNFFFVRKGAVADTIFNDLKKTRPPQLGTLSEGDAMGDANESTKDETSDKNNNNKEENTTDTTNASSSLTSTREAFPSSDNDDELSRTLRFVKDSSLHFFSFICKELSLETIRVVLQFLVASSSLSTTTVKTIDELIALENGDNKENSASLIKTLEKLLTPPRLGDASFEACLSQGQKSGPWLTKEEKQIHEDHFHSVLKLLLDFHSKGFLPISDELLRKRSLLIVCLNKMTSVGVVKMFIEEFSADVNYCGKHCDADDDADGQNYALTPLLAAVCRQHKDIVEYLLSLKGVINVTKNLEDSNGGWLMKLQNEYLLWKHQHEETMAWYSQPNDDLDIISDDDKKDNIQSCTLTLDQIMISHKSKVTSVGGMVEILELLLEAKTAEKRDMVAQLKSSKIKTC